MCCRSLALNTPAYRWQIGRGMQADRYESSSWGSQCAAAAISMLGVADPCKMICCMPVIIVAASVIGAPVSIDSFADFSTMFLEACVLTSWRSFLCFTLRWKLFDHRKIVDQHTVANDQAVHVLVTRCQWSFQYTAVIFKLCCCFPNCQGLQLIVSCWTWVNEHTICQLAISPWVLCFSQHTLHTKVVATSSVPTYGKVYGIRPN